VLFLFPAFVFFAASGVDLPAILCIIECVHKCGRIAGSSDEGYEAIVPIDRANTKRIQGNAWDEEEKGLQEVSDKMKLGIVGLPNVGKSTLFNSLTKAGAESANYPRCTIDPNVGVVAVPDERLKLLADMYNSAKVTPAVIEFVDFAGLVKGASKGEGLGNQFLANIREVDAIVHVVRCFEDTNVIHVDGSVDPVRDIETINLELIFSDLEILERRMAKTGRAANNDKAAAKELALMKALKAHLEDGQLAITYQTEDDEKQMFLEDLGLQESGLEKLIKASYSLLGLLSFLTAGEKETRAWTIKNGMKAPQAAGKIHSDFERGFIRAEVVNYRDLLDCGSLAAAREKGLVGLEGKDYVVQDGDVILFRCNV